MTNHALHQTNGDYSMKMIKGVIILSLLAMSALGVLNIAAASSMSTSETANHGSHIMDVNGALSIVTPRLKDPSINFMIISYPKQVNVG
jgi:hypothetical protein